MGIIRRQSIQATVVMAAGVLLGFVLKLFLFTAYLTPAEIGLLTVLLDVSNIFAAFIPLGSQSIFVKYLPHFKEDGIKSPRGLLFLGSTLSLLGFFIFTIVFLIFQDALTSFYQEQSPLFSRYIYYLLPLVLVRVIFTVGQSYARALKKNVFPLVIKEILVRVLTGVLVIAFATHWLDLDGLVLWFVIIYFISGAIMTFYIAKMGFMDFKPALHKLKQGRGLEIFNFGLFAIMTSTGEILIRNIDSLMLMSLQSLSAAGIYAIAFFIGQIIEMPRRAVTQITGPFVAEAAAKQDRIQLESIYHKSSINQFLVGVILLICVWTNIDNLLEIIPNGEDYRAGKYVVLFIGLGKLFDMSMGVNGSIIQNSPHYRFNFYTIALLAILGITTNLILIPSMGIVGAALASLFSISAVNIIRSVYVAKRFKLSPFRKNSLLAAIIAGWSYALALFLPELSSPYLDIVYRSGLTLTMFFALVIWLRVSEDLNEIFSSLKNKFF